MPNRTLPDPNHNPSRTATLVTEQQYGVQTLKMDVRVTAANRNTRHHPAVRVNAGLSHAQYSPCRLKT